MKAVIKSALPGLAYLTCLIGLAGAERLSNQYIAETAEKAAVQR